VAGVERAGSPAIVGAYRLAAADGQSTEALVAAGDYGYAHSCIDSSSFPARPLAPRGALEIVLLAFDGDVDARAALAAAAALGLEPPLYEDALRFGIAHPEVQRQAPVVFLHDPWVGHFGRRDVLTLWDNAGRRELGLDDFDDRWRPPSRFAFVRPAAAPGPAAP
jgi:hypothetical protein